MGTGGITFQRKQELGAFSVREGLKQRGDRRSMPGLGGVLPLNPTCQPWKEIGWRVGGQPPDCGRDGRALTAAREMTTAQPSPAQRADPVVPAGGSLRAWGGWGAHFGSLAAHKGAGFLRAWPALETETIRWHRGLCLLPSWLGDLPAKGAGEGFLGLGSTGFKNGVNEERRKES